MKLLFILVVMVSIIPLSVWAGTGSLSRAAQALREYMLVMAVLTVPAVVVAAISLLPRLWG